MGDTKGESFKMISYELSMSSLATKFPGSESYFVRDFHPVRCFIDATLTVFVGIAFRMASFGVFLG